MNNIIVDCVGNPEYDFYDDGDDSPKPFDDKNHYKYENLPDNIAIFKITTNDLSMELEYTLLMGKNKIIEFIKALKENTKGFLTTQPGSNQDASISTCDGIITFNFSGMGGDEPAFFKIKVPNFNCIEAFERLV